jgi:hypothetical protein
MSLSIDWSRLEEVVERAVRRARSEELREMAEAIKTLADFMKTGFKEMLDRVDRVEKRLEEMTKVVQEHTKTLQEHSKRLEEMSKTLAKHSKRLEGLSRRVERLDRTVMVVAHRFGVLSEEGFRDAMKFVVEEIFGVARVEKWVYNDVEGFVHGVPSIIEVDVVIRDKEYILLEVKSRVGRGDVYELSKVGKLYEKVTGIKPRLAILAGFMDRGVKELAEKLGVEVMPIAASFST